MAKYIVDLDDRYVNPENELIISHLNLFDGCSYHVGTVKLTPYTEPEAIREDGYKRGLKVGRIIGNAEGRKEAWECATKIVDMSWESKNEIFEKKHLLLSNLFHSMNATEAIEKIQSHEQEQIHVGDEVIAREGNAVVYDIDGDYVYFFYYKKKYCATGFSHLRDIKKTGRTFKEYADAMKLMREKEEE